MLALIFIKKVIFYLRSTLNVPNLAEIGWCQMILPQNQLVQRVLTADRGWCWCRMTKMALGIMVYCTNCFTPPGLKKKSLKKIDNF